MTQEEKHTLLVDLCARLPYGVCIRKKVCHSYQIEILSDIGKGQITDETYINGYLLEKSLPYLRPMSSMNDKEKKEFEEISNCVIYGNNDFDNQYGEYIYSYIDRNNINETTNWLNAHHFDFRGLIPMGLALEAKEGMYNTKTE